MFMLIYNLCSWYYQLIDKNTGLSVVPVSYEAMTDAFEVPASTSNYIYMDGLILQDFTVCLWVKLTDSDGDGFGDEALMSLSNGELRWYNWILHHTLYCYDERNGFL